jgi:hypothetical protein
MDYEEAVLASQTRLMLSQAQALTSDQGKDWLENSGDRFDVKPCVS